jgi:O-antigen/teichoic acid export membrane protein
MQTRSALSLLFNMTDFAFVILKKHDGTARPYVSILKNILVLWCGALVSSGIALLLPLLLSRILEKPEFGKLSAALTLIALAAPLANFGINNYWLRIYALKGKEAVAYIKPSLRLALMMTLLTCGLYFAWNLYSFKSAADLGLFQSLAVLILSQVCIDLMQARHQLANQYGYVAVWQTVQQLSRLTIVAYALWQQADLAFIIHAYAVNAGFISCFCLGCFIYMHRRDLRAAAQEEIHDEVQQPGPTLWQVFEGTWIYGVAGICYLIYFQIDIVLVEHLAGPEANASYAAAFVTLNGIYLLPSVFYQKYLLPKLHRWVVEDRKKVDKIYQVGNLLMMITGLAIMGLLLVCSKYLVLLLWGQNYFDTVEILNILAYSIPFKFLTMNMSGLLVTQKDMKIRLTGMSVVALTNIALNVKFIPLYQAHAAAWVTVISQFLLVLIYWGINRRNQKTAH